MDEKEVRKLERQSKEMVVITLIDVGMVISLDQKDKYNFVSFIKSVIQGEGDKCA